MSRLEGASVPRPLAAALSLVALAAVFALARVPARAADPVPGSAFAALRWRSIGPAIPSGRMTAVAGTDADPALYYAGAAGGGVWKSTNGGGTWAPVFDHQRVGAVGALAISPFDERVVWVGTGEANPRNDVSYGDGIYVTRDGGRRWQHRGLTASSHIAKILLDPRRRGTILVGALGDVFRDSTERGVYRSTDDGRTWRKTLYAGPQSGVSDLAFDPANPDVVYAGIWQFRRTPYGFSSGGANDGIYRSSDNGRTWTHLTGHGLPNVPLGRIGFATSPANHRRVYAVIQSRAGTIWRSDDGGGRWRRTSSDPVVNARPFYFSRIAADPRDANRVLALSMELSESRDGGRTFKIQTRTPHADHHDLWWSRDGRRAIEAQDGGVSISQDGGQTWVWPSDIVTAQIYHLGFDHQVPYHVCVALQDTHSYCGPSDSLDAVGNTNREWIETNGSDGMWIWPDPLDPNLIWDAYNDGELGIFDLRSQQRLNVAPAPREYVEFFGAADLKYRFQWYSPIAFDRHDPHAVYYAGNVVFKTTDRGRHWSVVSPDLTLNDKRKQAVSGGPINLDFTGADVVDTLLDLEVSPVDGRILWAGTDDGLIQLTRDGGAHWKNVSIAGVPPFGRIETVAPSNADAAAAYAIADRRFVGDRRPYVFRTSDYGASWTAISRGLPADDFARTIRPDERNPDLLYLGMENGIFVSFDRGDHWTSLQLNLPVAAVHDIRQQPESNDLIVGTHGRGAWILPDVAPLQELRAARASGARFFTPPVAHLLWYWNKQFAFNYDLVSSAPINVFAAPNPPFGVTLGYYLDRKQHRAPKIRITDASGRFVRELGAPLVSNRAGLNRVTWTLSEAGPVPYRGAAPFNRGGPDGAQVVPGTYTATLVLDGRTLAQPVEVRPDPRATWTQDEYQQAHDFAAAILADVSALDVALNRLDAIAAGRSPRERAVRADALALRTAITLNPQMAAPMTDRRPAVRERLQSLLYDVVGNSQGPALEGHLALQRDYHAETEALLKRFRALAASVAGTPAASTV